MKGQDSTGPRISQSLEQLATRWTVWGSNPGGGEILRTHLEWPWDPPRLQCNGDWFIPGGGG
jgi:hypothetical protein